MKTALLILLLTAMFSGARASESEGLFIAERGTVPRQEFQDGEIVTRWRAERLELTRAVLRYDTEDKKRYWLELNFTKWADPGDFYLFTIGGNNYQGFVLRGEGSNKGGGRWALGLTDAEAGRELLAKVAAAYNLPAKQALDRTQDEQGGGDKG